MPKKTKKSGSKFAAILGSRIFFWSVIAFFVFEATWIALSSRYPMAFDEGTHLGMIKLYAHQWSPLLLHQPDGPATLGAVVHNPSYLFYWLMNFPYRLLSSAFNPHVTVVILRLINVMFFAGGLVLFRKVLGQTKASAAIIHAVLLFFVLIPVVCLQAGQINYDNLLFLLLGWNLLQLLRFREQLIRKKSCDGVRLLGIAAVGMIASLTQFSYLPIFAAIVLYLVFLLSKNRKNLQKQLHKNWRATAPFWKYSTATGFVVALGLFVWTYSINLIKYHNVTPQCDQVLSLERCQANGPWARNYEYAKHPRPETNHNPLVYTGGWISGMVQRTFFVINGPSGPAPYANRAPLPILLIGSVLVFGIGIILVIRCWRQVLGSDPVLCLLLFISGGYTIALWGKLYYDYVRLDRLVAVNGRYLLLVILPMLVAAGLAYRQLLQERWQGWLAAAILVVSMQGGGLLSFLYFSNADWYWPDQPTMLRINQDAHHVVRAFILDWPASWQP